MVSRRRMLIGLTAAIAARISFAQTERKIWRIGILWERAQSAPTVAARVDAFRSGLRSLGYTEKTDFLIEQRYAGSDLSRLEALATELVALKMDVIVTPTTPAAMATRRITSTLPILIVTVGDPVGSGLAESLRHPGKNVTGLTNLSASLVTKHLDLLREILPRIRRVGYLYNPDNAANLTVLKQFQADCEKLRFKAIPAHVRNPQDVTTAFNTLRQEKAEGLIMSGANTNYDWRESILANIAKLRLPNIQASTPFVEAGGLVAYSSTGPDSFYRLASFADKIFKGAKASDLPIEQPSKFETVVNLKTAKALGITIPNSILLRADKVIE